MISLKNKIEIKDMNVITSQYDSQWYAVYTRSRAEKKLYSTLIQKNIECFLPLKKTLKQRSDRKIWVEEPLLSSYVFVKTVEKERFEVLNTPGAVRYISFEGRPVAIPEKQIESLAKITSEKSEEIEVYQGDLEKGNYVSITSGHLKGVEGEIVEIRGKKRLLLRFESLGCCVHAEVGLREIEAVNC